MEMSNKSYGFFGHEVNLMLPAIKFQYIDFSKYLSLLSVQFYHFFKLPSNLALHLD